MYRKPHTSQRHPAHTVSPSHLCDLEIIRPNHVWAADITSSKKGPRLENDQFSPTKNEFFLPMAALWKWQRSVSA